MQFHPTLRNARGDVIEATVGASAKLLFFAAAKSANCVAADPANLVATLNLPADWMDAFASGVGALLGSWTGAASGAGDIQSYRIKDSAGTTCYIQGNVTVTDGGGEMEVDAVSVVIGQTINVTAFTLTEGNA